MLFKDLIISRFYDIEGFDEDRTHIISESEKKEADKIIIISLIVSGIIGSIGAILLYLPHQLFPHFFPWHELEHPLIGKFVFRWGFSAYSIILGFIEVILLITLNLISVGYLSKIFRFPQKNYTNKEQHINQLINVSLEKKPKEMIEMGFDPHQGWNNWAISFFIIFIGLKASFTNIGIKILIDRFYEIPYLDYWVGIPVFAFWNIYGTQRVLYNAKLRIIATNIIDDFVSKLKIKYNNDQVPKYLFKEILQYITYCKRNFDHNHLYLTQKMQAELELPNYKVYCNTKKIVHRLENTPQEYRDDLVEIIVLGLIIDGDLSKTETKALTRLKNHNLLKYNIEDIKKMAKNIANGKEF